MKCPKNNSFKINKNYTLNKNEILKTYITKKYEDDSNIDVSMQTPHDNEFPGRLSED